MTLRAAVALAWAGVACAGSTPTECADLPAGAERDGCWRARVAALGPGSVDAVPPTAAQIADPLLRSMVISSWVETHAGSLSDAQVLALCDTLTGVDAQACARPYKTPHLR